MIKIRQVDNLNPEDLYRLRTGYTSDEKYLVNKTESERQCNFTLELVSLPQPYIKHWNHIDADTFDHYQRLPTLGFTFGAYGSQDCIGLILSEPRLWNKSLCIHELHVAGALRRQGIGRQLIETLDQKAHAAGLRILVCETQNTNVPAIHFYRNLGFNIEGIDLSYYSNDDFPEGEIALFMKKRLV